MEVLKKIMTCGIIMVLFATMMPAISATMPEGTSTEESVFNTYDKVSNTNRSVVILSGNLDQNDVREKISLSTLNVVVRYQATDISLSDIIIIDESWVSSQKSTGSIKNLNALVLQGTPIVQLGNSSDLLIEISEGLGLKVYGDGAQAYGLKYNPINGNKVCYCVKDMRTAQEALLHAYNWADDMVSQDEATTISNRVPYRNAIEKGDVTITSAPSWGSEVLKSIDSGAGSHGNYYIRTCYYKLQETNPNYNYYETHFKLQAVTNPGYSISDMVVISDADWDEPYGQYQNLLDYGPGEVGQGVATAGVNLGFQVSQDGVAYDVSASWSYSKPDVYIHDNSNFGSQRMHIWHDVREDLDVGHGTLMVQPGNVVRIDIGTGGDGKYHANYDAYRVTFCHDILWWHDNYVEYGTQTSTILS